MRKLSLVFVAAMLLSVGNVSANELNTVDPAKSLSVQISQMLINNTLDEDDVEFTAQVRFTLNNEHQIVVLSVDTKNKVLESFVKGRLNYSNVDLDDYREGKIYTIPVRIVS